MYIFSDLGFSDITDNSLDAVSDRDFIGKVSFTSLRSESFLIESAVWPCKLNVCLCPLAQLLLNLTSNHLLVLRNEIRWGHAAILCSNAIQLGFWRLTGKNKSGALEIYGQISSCYWFRLQDKSLFQRLSSSLPRLIQYWCHMRKHWPDKRLYTRFISWKTWILTISSQLPLLLFAILHVF